MWTWTWSESNTRTVILWSLMPQAKAKAVSPIRASRVSPERVNTEGLLLSLNPYAREGGPGEGCVGIAGGGGAELAGATFGATDAIT